ncbi:MAG: hypothetical protein AAGF53_15355 [Pseudomonadota bacterium]
MWGYKFVGLRFTSVCALALLTAVAISNPSYAFDAGGSSGGAGGSSGGSSGGAGGGTGGGSGGGSGGGDGSGGSDRDTLIVETDENPTGATSPAALGFADSNPDVSLDFIADFVLDRRCTGTNAPTCDFN